MAFDYRNIKNPAYFQENRVPAHSDHAFFSNMEELESGESGLRVSLNGWWKFHHALNPAQVIPGFEAADYDCRHWADIPVPAHIQMEGYGVPQYCNTQYPWDGCQDVAIGEIPEDFNPVASYVKYFYLPESFRSKRVFVSFQGAESCVAVWLNGHYVGYSSDSFTPSDFELTDYLTDGENKLACQVYRWSAGSWLEDQDFMRFSGLFREVFLYAVPRLHIADLKITTHLSDDFKHADLKLDIRLMGAEGWRLRVKLTDGDLTVATAEKSGSGEGVSLTMSVNQPKLWSSESPYLYDLTIEALDEKGELLEVVPQRVGFRRFAIEGGVMKLNGVRMVFKGVNRHDYCAETGRAVPEEKLCRDLITLKRNNINAIRTSHYPNSSALYRLCDELGFYVIDENNMETHGIWDRYMRGLIGLDDLLPGNRLDWQDILLDRVNSVFQRDKNHPCVVMWSCGNESMGGDVIYNMSQLFRELDPTRPVHYEGVDHDGRRSETSDVYSRMYTPVKALKAFIADHRDKPLILCEYVHSMGNSNGAMHWYTEYAYEEPLYQGGFIWDCLDQSVRSTDRYGQVTYNYGGDNGEMPHDGNFCGNGILFGNGDGSEKLQEVKYNYQNICCAVDSHKITVVNRSMFTDTRSYDCLLTLERDGVKIAEAILETDVPPLSEKSYPLPFPAQTRGGEYAITASFRLKAATEWADRGFEVAFGQGVYKVEAKKTPERHSPLRVVRGTNNVGVMGERFSALFSGMTGGLISYRFGSMELLKAMPMPNFWRAPIDNDRGNAMPQRYAQWKLASLYATPRDPETLQPNEPFIPVVENEDGSVTLEFTWTLPTNPVAGCKIIYTVHPCGRVDMSLHYDPVEGLGDMPEFGLMFKLDADYDQVRWYGLGPDENYVDRHQGARLGIWQRSVREMMQPYLVPQECGNRTGVRWAEVTDYKGRGLRFIGDNMEFSALPWTPHEIENAAHHYELPPIHYTVVRASLMQMGVGGDDSWGARTHGEYLIDVSKPLHFKVSFEGKL